MLWKKHSPEVPPAWMIVGLGNPGGEYKGTRHNVGFEVIDQLGEKNRIKVTRAKQRALTGQGVINDTSVMLVKPLTFMNLSGQSVGPLARIYDLKPENIFVIADDLDLPVGKLRIKLGGSAGGHNGHKSLIQTLKTEDYPRLKIGIGSVGKSDTIDHVLGSFDRDERPVMEDVIRASVKVCEALALGGIESALRAVEEFNR